LDSARSERERIFDVVPLMDITVQFAGEIADAAALERTPGCS
jgi:hypothetical protein